MNWRLRAFLLLFGLVAFPVAAQSLTDAQLSEVRFDQKLNTQVSLDLRFRDETGRTVRLGDYFGQKPVILVLGYYECPMLCTLTFNGLVEGLNDMKWSIGKEFNVIHVSIDPKETPALAAAKKQTYLKRYGRAGATTGWHFLTGDDASIKALAAEVGFSYAYDSSVHQYAHPSGLVVLTPEGRVAKYLFGVKFMPSDIYAALQGASAHKIGSPIERLFLLCFHYSPVHGKYSGIVVIAIRSFAVITLCVMTWFAVVMFKREKNRHERLEQPAGAAAVTNSAAKS